VLEADVSLWTCGHKYWCLNFGKSGLRKWHGKGTSFKNTGINCGFSSKKIWNMIRIFYLFLILTSLSAVTDFKSWQLMWRFRLIHLLFLFMYFSVLSFFPRLSAYLLLHLPFSCILIFYNCHYVTYSITKDLRGWILHVKR